MIRVQTSLISTAISVVFSTLCIINVSELVSISLWLKSMVIASVIMLMIWQNQQMMKVFEICSQLIGLEIAKDILTNIEYEVKNNNKNKE